MKSTLDLDHLIGPDALAVSIGDKFQRWNQNRINWVDQKKELRNYVFATDTTTTTNKSNPWFNSTAIPKIAQLYDNLNANYMATMFPNAQWMRWKAEDDDSAVKEKAEVIQSYMETKVQQSGFEQTMAELIADWVLYGNCFASVEWVEDVVTGDAGDTHASYIGPKLVRVSPYDIVFDPTSRSFYDTPKIIRSLVSMGQVEQMAKNSPDPEKYLEIISKMKNTRRDALTPQATLEKSEAYVADGFSNITDYYTSGMVEILTMYGDIYDHESGEYKENVQITVLDRAYVVDEQPVATWLGGTPVYHAGWRERPDNLYAMGPLDNLVGMQYRINHLENLRADAFDQIAYPARIIQGSVEEFEYGPGVDIYVGEEGSVTFLAPDTTALQADFQIPDLMRKMEELAGAPSSAMGIRTPGEKTAFEVNSLQNAASRIFQHKSNHFERVFLQPVLNGMLEAARVNMDKSDVIRISDKDNGVDIFDSITRADLKGNGKIVPLGASHFAERATRMQNLQSMMQMKADQSVGTHISGKRLAEIIAHELGEKELYGENIAVVEGLETQRASQDAEAINVSELQGKAELGL